MTTQPRTPVRAAVLLGAAALGLTACTATGTHHPGATRSADAMSATATATPAAADHPWQDPLDSLRADATRVLVDTGRHTDAGEQLPIPATDRGTLLTAIACRGHGVLTVRVGRAGTYRLPCDGPGNGDETETSVSDTPLPAAVLDVQPAAGITWQVVVGWSPDTTTPDHPTPLHSTTPHPGYSHPTPRRTTAPHTTAPHTTEPEPEPTHPHTTAPHPEPTHTTPRHTTAPRPRHTGH